MQKTAGMARGAIALRAQALVVLVACLAWAIEAQLNIPRFYPDHFTFDEGSVVNIICLTDGGNPPAELLLEVNNGAGLRLNFTGTNAVQSRFWALPEWHEAMVTCRVTNYANQTSMVNRTLIVKSRPHILEFLPEKLAFETGQMMTIICRAQGGHPKANLSLEFALGNRLIESSSGAELMIYRRNASEEWHNVTATCRVTNYPALNLFVQRVMEIYSPPSPPQISPARLLFDAGDMANISCFSYGGYPEANVSLELRLGTHLLTALSGIQSALVHEVALAEWHNATAACRITNRHGPNSSISRTVKVNHIIASRSTLQACNAGTEDTLDCTSVISSYPSPKISWSAPGGEVVGADAKLSVKKRAPGMYTCTATNPSNHKRVVVLFNCTSDDYNPTYTDSGASNKSLLIGVLLAALLATVLTVGLLILGYRRYRSRRNPIILPLPNYQEAETSIDAQIVSPPPGHNEPQNASGASEGIRS